MKTDSFIRWIIVAARKNYSKLSITSRVHGVEPRRRYLDVKKLGDTRFLPDDIHIYLTTQIFKKKKKSNCKQLPELDWMNCCY